MNESGPKKPSAFGLSKNVLSMGAVSFLNDLSSDMIFPFIPAFVTTVLGGSAAFVGVIEGVADATQSILKIISGRFSDRWKRRKPFLVLGYGLSAFSKPLLSLAASPWHVLAVRFLDRVGKGTRDAPRDALISFSSARNVIGRAFGFHRGSDTLGAAIGPVIALLVLPLVGNNLRILFLLSFVASFIAVVILAFTVREVSDGNTVPGAPRASTLPKKFRFRSLGIPFLVFLASATILNLGRVSEAFLLLRAQDIGIALMFLPLVYVVYNVSFAVFSTPAGILSDHIGHRNTFMVGMLVFSTSALLFGNSASIASIWVLMGLYGLYSALTEGVGKAIITDLVSEDSLGTAFGIYSAFTGIALLPASVIFGVLWQKLGPENAFYYSALLGSLSLIVFLFLRIKKHEF